MVKQCHVHREHVWLACISPPAASLTDRQTDRQMEDHQAHKSTQKQCICTKDTWQALSASLDSLKMIDTKQGLQEALQGCTEQIALDRPDLSHMCLAHHEPESKTIIIWVRVCHANTVLCCRLLGQGFSCPWER